jgi:hypothetical protein
VAHLHKSPDRYCNFEELLLCPLQKAPPLYIRPRLNHCTVGRGWYTSWGIIRSRVMEACRCSWCPPTLRRRPRFHTTRQDKIHTPGCLRAGVHCRTPIGYTPRSHRPSRFVLPSLRQGVPRNWSTRCSACHETRRLSHSYTVLETTDSRRRRRKASTVCTACARWRGRSWCVAGSGSGRVGSGRVGERGTRRVHIAAAPISYRLVAAERRGTTPLLPV